MCVCHSAFQKETDKGKPSVTLLLPELQTGVTLDVAQVDEK